MHSSWAQRAPTLEAQARPFAPAYLRPSPANHPPDNAPTPARELLGKTLFFDPRLSGSQIVSCATCHNPLFNWQDGLPVGLGNGMRRLGRRTSTLLNLAWGGPYTWDGRSETLEAQALGPIASPAIMNMPLDKLVERLRRIPGYAPLFERAYPGEKITPKTIGKALAAFERTIVSGPSAFDQWAAGDSGAMSDAAKRGFVLFNTKGGCAACHTGWRFTDDGFHDIGIAGSDKGRGNVLQTVKAMEFAFKTPTLRDVAERPPYMHNGSLPTLEAVVDNYSRGGTVARPTLDTGVRRLKLTKGERSDLVALLNALSSKVSTIEMPVLPR